MAERVIARGADERQVHVITNWCDDEEVRPVARGDNPLRRHWQLQDKFVVGYSGNLGRAHEFATVLAAAGRLKDNPRIVFLMVGGGHQMDTLSREVKARGLVQSFRFFPYQERELLRHSLAVADVHWISLKPEVEGLIVPSKVYGIAAVGRPIIAITAKDGEIAALVDRYQCGLVIEPGKSDDLANALSRLSARPDETASMGERARAMLEAHFSRRLALERWRGVLDQVRS
jgi:glycosyltransferase involved in cell wall biosynthesis